MKPVILASLSGLLALGSAEAQLVGIGYNVSTHDHEFFTVAGSATLLNRFDFAAGSWEAATLAADTTVGLAYAVSGSTLYKFNIFTGAIVGTSPLGTSLRAVDTASSALVGIGYNLATQDNEFYAIDPTSGTATLLNSFDFASGVWEPATFTADAAAGLAYAVSKDTLYKFDISTGAVVGTSALATSLQAVDTVSSALVGIGYNLATQDNEFYAIDPTSGTATLLNSFDFASGGWEPATFTVDDPAGLAYAVSGSTLYKFDISTGAIVGTSALGTSLQAVVVVPEPSCFHLLVSAFAIGIGVVAAHRLTHSKGEA